MDNMYKLPEPAFNSELVTLLFEIERLRAIKGLVDRNLLRRSSDGPRFYHLSLARGPIAARLIRRLDELGYLPKMLSDD